MKKKIMRLLKSRKGGIPTIITIIATTVAAMGLFSYTIINQASSAKEAGDKALVEQNKLNMMLENHDYVTGKTVLDFVKRLGEGSVEILESDGTTSMTAAQVDKQALFSYDPVYNADGRISGAQFTQINLGS